MEIFCLVLYIWFCSYCLLEIIGLARFEPDVWLGSDMQYDWWFWDLNPWTTDLEVKEWVMLVVNLPLAALLYLYVWIKND